MLDSWSVVGITLIEMDSHDDKPKTCQIVQAHEPRVEPGESIRHVLDVSPGALMVADHRGVITHANRAAKDILDATPESLIGCRVDQLSIRLARMDGTLIDPSDNPMARVLRDQTEITNEEMELITPLGELKFLLVSSAPLTDEHGCMAGVVSSFFDITERKRSQKALEESERRLRLMLDNMNDIVFLMDTQANLIYVSPSIEKHTGWMPEELVNAGPLIQITDRLIFPDDKDKMLNLWQRSLNGETSDDVEFRGFTRDGRILWFSASWSPVKDENGRIVAVQGASRDITERVLAREARTRLAEEKRDFYKATIAAFTGGKLEIIEPDQADELIRDPEISVQVVGPEDAPVAREMVRDVCLRHGLGKRVVDDFIMAVGEAITNAIKHGQGGRVLAGFNGEDVWVAVIDRGPGIETLAIPRVTLERGYSSQISMGMGYSMILNLADRTWLSTGPDGTTVIMTCCAPASDEKTLLGSLADTW